MYLDVTKNSYDKNDYQTEFQQLQEQLVNIQNEKYSTASLSLHLGDGSRQLDHPRWHHPTSR